MIIGGLYSIYWFLTKNSKTELEWIRFGFVIFFVILLAYTFLRFIRRKIILYEDKIFVSEDMGGKDVKLQYEVNLSFKQIEKIFLEISTKNSLNKNMRWVITPMP